jgi:hypothetical protein
MLAILMWLNERNQRTNLPKPKYFVAHMVPEDDSDIKEASAMVPPTP